MTDKFAGASTSIDHQAGGDSVDSIAAKAKASRTRAMKYILVSGGVISGVGKGVISSSLGVILQRHGLVVTAIKIDPYLNIDAGTFSPYEHGETFVLDDGGEVDLDLGNYERFLDIRLHRDNNITTGKVYDRVIKRERNGDYLGKTVQVIPHVTDAIQEWVERVAHVPVHTTSGQRLPVDVCIIELGGTIGDIESMAFVEAFRQFQLRVGRENLMNVHVSLILETNSTGEQKTKPTQNSVRQLRNLGLWPDLVICRSHSKLTKPVTEKLALFCDVKEDQVISVCDVPNIYHVPLMLHDQDVLNFTVRRLQLDLPQQMSGTFPDIGKYVSPDMQKWIDLAHMTDKQNEVVTIGLVGKYVELPDAYTSVGKALRHAATHAGRTLKIEYIHSEQLTDDESGEVWQRLHGCDGLIVPGGFGGRGIEGKINAIRWARTKRIPFLGICLGMQCAAIEFARNVLGIEGAHSTEFATNLVPEQQVVVDMPEHTAAAGGQGMGATMRLGKRTTVFLTPRSLLRQLYGCTQQTSSTSSTSTSQSQMMVDERHRHRYEINPSLVPELAGRGLHFTGMGVDENAAEDVLTGHMQRTQSSARLLSMALANGTQDLCAKLRGLCRDKLLGGDKPIRMEILELQQHPYFVGVQFHPEYLSHPLRPSAPYLGLVLAASGQLDSYLADRQSVPGTLTSRNATVNTNSGDDTGTQSPIQKIAHAGSPGLAAKQSHNNMAADAPPRSVENY